MSARGNSFKIIVLDEGYVVEATAGEPVETPQGRQFIARQSAVLEREALRTALDAWLNEQSDLNPGVARFPAKN